MNNIKLIAFDLDGTVTQHKSKLCDDNRKVLEELASKYKVIFVGAGSCERINTQLNGFHTEIIGCYGMETGKYNSEKDTFEVVERLKVSVDKVDISEKVNKLREKFGFIDFAGEGVEFHESGMITFPILGTKAELKDKLEYDPDRSKRRKIYNQVVETFSDYNVVIGGTSSFDIIPKPYTKLNALEKFVDNNNIDRNEVVYIGDDYGVGGNDEPIYKSDIKFICIDDYRELGNIIKKNML